MLPSDGGGSNDDGGCADCEGFDGGDSAGNVNDPGVGNDGGGGGCASAATLGSFQVDCVE